MENPSLNVIFVGCGQEIKKGAKEHMTQTGEKKFTDALVVDRLGIK